MGTSGSTRRRRTTTTNMQDSTREQALSHLFQERHVVLQRQNVLVGHANLAHNNTASHTPMTAEQCAVELQAVPRSASYAALSGCLDD